ncbi:hypothetical protein [Kribbella sindirgiensis]|uniref:Uncharacterized protein n=1 Tax=Kribbella sindirgiensis TaxID=1124744 RepID=A0A4R0JNS1_9ACTN|nr:hypothetical protein [Kribbella sindirgiensis]TCC43615.1 hypothetical protein E0H50_03990 [Kribbella sindirgiensis]
MPAQSLTLKERAVLLALLAEARPITNVELREAAGLTLDGASRYKLNDLKLVISQKEGRSFVHELTEDGTKWCENELSAERPERAGSVGGALYALLAGLHRYLQRTGLRLVELFPAAEPDLETRIRSAYRTLSADSGLPWVGLVALRNELADVAREELDSALQQLSRQPGIHVQAEANQQALTDADHESAVRFGGSSRHLLKIENP